MDKLQEYSIQQYKRLACVFVEQESDFGAISELLSNISDKLPSQSLATVPVIVSDETTLNIDPLLRLCGISRRSLVLPDLVILESTTISSSGESSNNGESSNSGISGESSNSGWTPFLVDATGLLRSQRLTASNFNDWPRNCLRAILTPDIDNVIRHFGPSFPEARLTSSALLSTTAYPGDTAIIRSRWTSSRKSFPCYLNPPYPVDLEDDDNEPNPPLREPRSDREISLPATIFCELGFLQGGENLVSVEISELEIAEKVTFAPVHSLEISEEDALQKLKAYFGLQENAESERSTQSLLSAAEDNDIHVTDLESQYLESYCRRAVCRNLPLVVGSIIAVTRGNALNTEQQQLSLFDTCYNNYPKECGWIAFQVTSTIPRFQAVLVGSETLISL